MASSHVMASPSGSGAVAHVDCVDCGEYYAAGSMYQPSIEDDPNIDWSARRHISGWVRDRWRRGQRNIVVNRDDFTAVLKAVPRLTPIQRVEHLLITLSRITKLPGSMVAMTEIRPSDAWAESAAEIDEYLRWLIDQNSIRLLGGQGALLLTIPGWVEVGRLLEQRGAVANRAFIAMRFGDAILDRVVDDHFKPACASAGFDLLRLNERQPAGLIDDQMRVAIRTAKFLICDLTHGNRGAYWEAGFAEGIGRKVIFTCRTTEFNSKDYNVRPHFDTNHMVTIQWDPLNVQVAANELKNVIRATFPGDAKMED